MSVVTTPAVLLRSFNYSETSRILRLYTLDLGLVGGMAKGMWRGGAPGGRGALAGADDDRQLTLGGNVSDVRAANRLGGWVAPARV